MIIGALLGWGIPACAFAYLFGRFQEARSWQNADDEPVTFTELSPQ